MWRNGSKFQKKKKDSISIALSSTEKKEKILTKPDIITVLIQLWINYILFYFSLGKVTRAMFMFRRRTNLNSDLLLCIWWTSLRLQVFVDCCHWLLGISTFSWTNKVGFTMTSFLPLLLFSYQIPWCINCQFA